MNNKTIYHFGNLAGYPYVLANGFRKKGYKSINIIPSTKDDGGVTKSENDKKSNRQLPYDKVLFYNNDLKIIKIVKAFKLIFEVIRNGSIIHYHGGSILPRDLDTYIFKFFNIPMVKSWGGGDARIIEEAASLNPYYHTFRYPEKDFKIRTMLKRLSKNGVKIATDPEMATYSKPYFKKIYTFRAPMNLKKIKKQNITNEKIIKFLHIPTHSFVKGTIHIKNAFERLNLKGFTFEFILMEPNLTQKDVWDKIRECDVYIDDICGGAYGITALEAAALGKTTIVYIREDTIRDLPNTLPFVSANPDTIYDNLKDLIINPEKRHEIGKKSRAYVEKYHDVDVVVDDMIKLYREVGADI